MTLHCVQFIRSGRSGLGGLRYRGFRRPFRRPKISLRSGSDNLFGSSRVVSFMLCQFRLEYGFYTVRCGALCLGYVLCVRSWSGVTMRSFQSV